MGPQEVNGWMRRSLPGGRAAKLPRLPTCSCLASPGTEGRAGPCQGFPRLEFCSTPRGTDLTLPDSTRQGLPPVPDRVHTVGPAGEEGVACPLGARLRNAGHLAHWPGAPRCPGRALLPTLLGHPASLPWTDWFGSPIQSPPSLSSGGDGLRPAQQALCLCHSGLSSETERPTVGV